MNIMVNGLPGNMAKEVISAAVKRGYTPIPYSLTAESETLKTVEHEGISFTLLKPSTRDSEISSIKERYGDFITVDYTHPTAVNSNAEFYGKHALPFVMGTTGGDRQALIEGVEKNALYAVIAPNMAKQIVALQAMLTMAQEQFPNLYKNYTLTVVESHQKTKADTSGTAKAIVETFNAMGIKAFAESSIEMVRNEDEMMDRMEVPKEYLGGHAYHTYRLLSPDGTVAFEFRHNVCGRSIYAEGTVDAAEFLQKEIDKKSSAKVYTMIDVLRSGAMK